MRKKHPKVVAVLHNVRSLHNVGSIFRTADAAGVSKLFLTGITPSPRDRFGAYRPQIAKVSLGAEKYVPWEKKIRIAPLLHELKFQGFTIGVIEQSLQAIPYHIWKLKGKMPPKIALIVGNEVKGLPKQVVSRADVILQIPMYGKKESLNVGVAFGIVVFGLLT